MKNIISKKNYLLPLILIIATAVSSCVDNDNINASGSGAYYMSTEFITITQNDWIKATDNLGNWDNGHWYCRIDVPAITQDVISSGAVLVYYEDNNGNWVLLPYATTLYNSKENLFTEEIWSGYSLGIVDIDFVRTNELNLTPVDILNIKITILQY
jgi:hypothetical protein